MKTTVLHFFQPKTELLTTCLTIYVNLFTHACILTLIYSFMGLLALIPELNPISVNAQMNRIVEKIKQLYNTNIKG
uniref:Uncharacterized protein n=1 Tax=Rhizophora mucronata TaxID=61149 RepID=A0A2P2NMS6_RHIMU